MNILCIDQYSTPGGGQQSLLDLLPAFRTRGWTVHVALPGGGVLAQAVQRHQIPVHTLDPGTYTLIKKSGRDMLRYAAMQPGLMFRIARLVRKNRIDLLYVNGPRMVPAAATVSQLLRVPILFHCHNRLLQQSVAMLTGRSLGWARGHTIGCCKFAAEPLLPFQGEQRVRIIFNGVAEMFSGARRQSDRIRHIGVVGRVEEQKGQLEFVRAAREIASASPSCTFHVIGAPMFSGTGYYDLVVRESAGLNMRFHGWTDNVKAALAGLDLLVVPSKSVEATTRVIFEGFSACLPVLAFPSGGIVEVLQDGVNGFLTDSDSPNSLARRTIDVLRMPGSSLNAVTARARRSWERDFNLTTYQERVCSVVESLTRGQPASGPSHTQH